MKKTILFLINSLRVGGAEKILVDTLKSLDYNKYDVSLIYFVEGGEYKNDIPKQVKCKCVLGMGSRLDNLFRGILSKLNLLDGYYRWSIRNNVAQYDTIISYLEGFPTRMHSYILDRAGKNISFVHTDLETFRDSEKQFPPSENQEAVYSRMDEIIFVSQHAKESFERLFFSNDVKHTVLRNFIDVNNVYYQSIEEQIPHRDFTVVTVGRLAPVKGIDIIPVVARIIKEKGYRMHFTIVGDGSDYNKVAQQIIDNDVEDMVTMVGFKKNPYPYILASDVYLNTSYTEGMPLSLCEAMTLGRPVVASNTSGAIELLGTEQGILVQRCARDISDALLKLYSDPILRTKMAEAGIAYSVRFDKRKYIHELCNLI